MTKNHRPSQADNNRSRGAPRNPNGVIATLERITRQTPLPRDVRDTANKYLRNKELFPKQGGPLDTYAGKLGRPGSHDLLINALTLDQIFRGDTKLVVRLLRGEVERPELLKQCADAREDIARRARVYGYWSQRMSSLEATLQEADLRKQPLEPLLKVDVEERSGFHDPVAPLALRAVRTLEHSELRSSLKGPTATSLVEQAEAYLTLSDFDTAEARATRAIHLEPANARAWFIRVVAALKRRNRHVATTLRRHMEAVEIAEPMSAHERSAHEWADDAGIAAADSQQALDEIVPQALLHWPKSAGGRYEHQAWRSTLLQLLVEQAFQKLRIGGYLGESRRAFELNGFDREWCLKLDAPEGHRASGEVRPECPLAQSEVDALSDLFAEHDRDPDWVFPLGRGDVHALDFQLLHLRWVLGNGGYERHWERASSEMRRMHPESFYRAIVSSPTLAPLWFSHCVRHDGIDSARGAMKAWTRQARDASRERSALRALEIEALAYHHQFARDDYAGCVATCSAATELLSGGVRTTAAYGLPFEPQISIPITSALYWQYLTALAAVMMRARGLALPPRAIEVLEEADHWQDAFRADDGCFWTFAEEYEGGGGEDYLVPAYDVDLRIADNWQNPTRDRDRPVEGDLTSGAKHPVRSQG